MGGGDKGSTTRSTKGHLVLNPTGRTERKGKTERGVRVEEGAVGREGSGEGAGGLVQWGGGYML